MITIWKYRLDVIDEQTIEVPFEAKALSVQMQNAELCIWCLVKTDNKLVPMHIRIFGTGHPVVDVPDKSYVGTFQEGWFVGHVFAFRI